jgi:methylated-DNA-protein-cysteine methyltransferase related protein
VDFSGTDSFKEKVISVIKKIPYGKVTTYGTVAAIAGSPRSAREVGYILHSQTEKYVLPWQRVVNRKGYISIRGGDVNMKNLQKKLLEDEGVEVSEDFMVDLSLYGWWGEGNLDHRKLEKQLKLV